MLKTERKGRRKEEVEEEEEGRRREEEGEDATARDCLGHDFGAGALND